MKRIIIYKRTFLTLAVIASGILSLPSALSADIPVPYSLGEQTTENNYQTFLTEVFAEDFNDPTKLNNGINIAIPDAAFTNEAALLIDGAYSLRMTGLQSIVQIPSAINGLLPNTVYEVTMRYRVLYHTEGLGILGVGFSWPGFSAGEWSGGVADTVLGDAIGDDSRVWEYRRLMNTGEEPQIDLYVGVFGSDIVIDSLRVYRRDSVLLPAEPPIIEASFPRLGNYNLLSAQVTAQGATSIDVETVYETLGLFDFVTGYDIDHTIGVSDVGSRLRQINPNIILLPYFQSFVYQERPVAAPNGVAGLLPNFNTYVADEWFMLNPDGERLEEPNFLGNFQLDHTTFGASVNGVTFVDYAHEFLARSVLPTGAWDGIHFDQAEWYPNPLLAEGNAFLNQDLELPPIDINRDGIADTEAFLFAAWEDAFNTYFDKIAARFGYTKLLFGNAGELPNRPSVMRRMNGFQREFTSPFPILDNGDLATEFPTRWYDLMSRYQSLGKNLRAPQLPNFQFTGFKLGIPTGDNTENGLPDREPVLEARDFRRMRLGLSTVLMGDGFFGYDFVDNTTAPVWFDEYAVAADGVAVKSIAGKGYLGQPLNEADEIPIDSELVMLADFESDPDLPPGFYLGQYITYTDDPSQVIDGVGSVVIDSRSLDTLGERAILISTPLEYPLEVGETYHLSADYKVLDYEPDKPGEALVLIERAAFDGAAVPTSGGAALFDPEPGLEGTLRLAFVATRSDIEMFIAMTDRGRVVFDNLKLEKGAGGVFRRDFENGTVIVNPTPEALFVSQALLSGTLGRSNLRRIAGTQDPAVNSGAAVSDGILIPSADGIVLLADSIVAQPPGTATNLFVVGNEDNCDVQWTPATGTVAGYLLRYGLTGGDLTQFSIANTGLGGRIEHLESGSSYTLNVTAFDFAGNMGISSPTVQCVTSGNPGPERPQIANAPVLSPGSFAELQGTAFSTDGSFISAPVFPTTLVGTEVLVNGVAVPLASVEPNKITFIVPSMLGGNAASVRVRRNGVISSARMVPVVPATPFLWIWDGSNFAIALHADTFTPVTAEDPALPGDSVVILTSGVGRYEPHAPDGMQPVTGSVAAQPIEVLVGTSIVTGAAVPAPWFGFSLLSFEMPTGVQSGETPISATIGGIESNVAIVVTGAGGQ